MDTILEIEIEIRVKMCSHPGKLSSADRMLKLLLQSSANVFLLVIMISCSLEKGNASRGIVDGLEAHQYQTLPLSSMLPPFVCNQTTSKGTGRKASMKVANRYGPCSARGQDYSTAMKEILLRDESRFQSIQARLAKNNNNGDMGESESVDLRPVNDISTGGGNYYVTVGLGTPPKHVELDFDTGSHLTWTQCQPCAVLCYPQRLPRFDPAASTTYSNLSCTSQPCAQLKATTYNNPGKCGDSNTCTYTANYGDESHSIGQLATDKLTLTSTDVVDGFIFGCGQDNNFTYGGGSAGLMGLGADPLSIVSQTCQQFGNYFSYCLPTVTGSDGHLTFGKNSNNNNNNNLKYTPFLNLDKDLYYFIELVSITVNGQPLSISQTLFQNPGTYIDSGTVTTRLPTLAYNALRDTFKQQMTMYPLVQNPSIPLFDTCYDFTNYPNPTIPKISFTFGGDVVVDLDPKGVMLPLYGKSSEVCLAFASSTTGGVFGNYQQQTFEVVYDVAGGQLGFAPGGCS